MNELLVMKDITKDFSGGRALDNVSFSIFKGEIRGLIGENGAGKTTLMNILSGNYPYGTYQGEFFFSGKPCHFVSPKDGEKSGIAIIHQELSLVQGMSIADNLFLGNEIGNRFFVDRKKTFEETEKILRLVGLDESPDTLVEELGAGKQQLVEIAKALSKNPELLILDEPTSSLGQEHFEKLSELMMNLKSQGKTMIIISHKLNEIMKVSDRITILRDGKIIDTIDNLDKNADERYLIKGMAGHDISELYPKKTNKVSDEIALKVDHYEIESERRKGALSLKDISFVIHKGEVVGLYGLMASGRSKLVKSLFGRSNGFTARGNVEIYGKRVELKTPKEAIEAGIAYVAEDRMKTGLSLERNIRENMTLPGLEKITIRGLLDKAEEKTVARDNVEHFQIKARSYEQDVKELSGGNQQKVMLSQWFYTDPKILILDEPTKGIDVGAKYEIYNIINEYAASGGAVLLISSDMSEIFGLSDRIYVLSEGRITGELDRDEFSADKVMTYILKEDQLS
jgi:putative multiple sugar transport system ATP-binding protein